MSCYLVLEIDRKDALALTARACPDKNAAVECALGLALRDQTVENTEDAHERALVQLRTYEFLDSGAYVIQIVAVVPHYPGTWQLAMTRKPTTPGAWQEDLQADLFDPRGGKPAPERPAASALSFALLGAAASVYIVASILERLMR